MANYQTSSGANYHYYYPTSSGSSTITYSNPDHQYSFGATSAIVEKCSLTWSDLFYRFCLVLTEVNTKDGSYRENCRMLPNNIMVLPK